MKYKKSVLFCFELIYLRLRKCNSSARHQNLRSGTFPSRARSKAFFPAGAGQNLRLRRDWALSNCDVLSPDFQGRRPVLTLLRQEKVGNFCFLKISRMSCISWSGARFFGFSSNEVRFKGVRARPVGGAGAHAPEEVHLHERSEVLRFSDSANI